jgi:hypothetical protein
MDRTARGVSTVTSCTATIHEKRVYMTERVCEIKEVKKNITVLSVEV